MGMGSRELLSGETVASLPSTTEPASLHDEHDAPAELPVGALVDDHADRRVAEAEAAAASYQAALQGVVAGCCDRVGRECVVW